MHEMLALSGIHLVENMLMMIPLTLTFVKISARHALLEHSIGVTAMETYSMDMSMALLLVGYLVAVLSFILEDIVYYIYHKYFNIWGMLLRDADTLEKETRKRQHFREQVR